MIFRVLVVFKIIAIVTKTQSRSRWSNCSQILCPTRENECVALDEIFKCSATFVFLPDVNDIPILSTYDIFTKEFKANAVNVSFDDARSLWGRLKYIDIVHLSLGKFCDSEGLNSRWRSLDSKTSCTETDPRFTTVDVNHFSTMSSIKFLNLNEMCARNFVGNLTEKFSGLGIINLSKNFLREVPFSVRSATSAKILDLSENVISELTKEDFGYFGSLSELYLRSNCIQDLPEDVFLNLSKLKILSLVGNHLVNLPESLLSYLVNLKEFYASQNYIANLPEKLFQNTPNLRNIYLNDNQISYLPDNLLLGVNKIETFNLSNNKLTFLSQNTFKSAMYFKQIVLSRNLFTEIPSIIYENPFVLNPPSIDLSGNLITNVIGHITSKIPVANNLILSENCLKFVDDYDTKQLLPFKKNITQLQCENCCIKEIHRRMFQGIENLNLRSNNITKLTLSDLKQLSKHKTVDLSYNMITTVEVDLDNPLFRESKDITKVVLNHNSFICDCDLLHFLIYINYPYFETWDTSLWNFVVHGERCKGPPFFEYVQLPSLTLEDIESPFVTNCPKNCTCLLKCFTAKVIINCKNEGLLEFPDIYPDVHWKLNINVSNNHINSLPAKDSLIWNRTQSLNLKNNRITSLTNFTITPALTYLNIRDNKITHFEPELIKIFEDVKTKREREIELSGNPWQCSCDLKNKLNVILNNKRVTIKDNKKLKCIWNNRFYKFLEFDIFCPNNSPSYPTTAQFAFLPVIIVTSIISFLFFKYKVQIKYFLFSRNLCLWWVSEEDLDADKEYDAFISYSSLDSEWVNRVLVSGLENENPRYKICLHERDWFAGALIADQIVKSVENSRRTILVLTDNFLNSEWSRVEFTVAYQRSVEDKMKRVLVVIPNEVPDLDKCESEFRSFVVLTTYIEFIKPHFWRKLRCSMPRRKNLLRKDGGGN